jgi:hypothetical protein
VSPEQIAEIEQHVAALGDGEHLTQAHAERRALLAEVKRLREVEMLWHRAGSIVERAIAKGYEIGGVELDDLAEALGIDVGEVSR